MCGDHVCANEGDDKKNDGAQAYGVAKKEPTKEHVPEGVCIEEGEGVAGGEEFIGRIADTNVDQIENTIEYGMAYAGKAAWEGTGDIRGGGKYVGEDRVCCRSCRNLGCKISGDVFQENWI